MQKSPRNPLKFHLDLPVPSGIGNIVLLLAGFRAWCIRRGVQRPVVRCQCPPSDLAGIRPEAFRFVRECPPGSVSVPASMFCNLAMLEAVGGSIRDIVVPMDVGGIDCPAAFCIRTGDAKHDGGARFMNRAAIDAMKVLMAKHVAADGGAMVFSNDPANLRDLPPGVSVYQVPDAGQRNTPAHWLQWHALSRFSVVYHGVAGAADGSLTSTFAPTAVAYGGHGQPVGIDNNGRVLMGRGYYWPDPKGTSPGSPARCAPGAAGTRC